MRNVLTQAETGKAIIKDSQDLTVEELKQLFEILRNKGNNDAIWDSLTTAFYFGFAVGNRQAKRQK